MQVLLSAPIKAACMERFPYTNTVLSYPSSRKNTEYWEYGFSWDSCTSHLGCCDVF